MPEKNEQKPIVPSYSTADENESEPNVSRVEKTYGMFQTPDVVPTHVARKLDEQIKIFSGKAYIYDTASGTWIALITVSDVPVYSAVVESDGTKTSGSSILSVVKTPTGVYTITHNLGHTTYSAVAVGYSSGTLFLALITDLNSNSVVVRTFNTSFAATDSAFQIIIHSHAA
jgi:hypothetical protein